MNNQDIPPAFKNRVIGLVNFAIELGVLIRPSSCEKCGQENKIIHGHHEDYMDPLKVNWLCPHCHRARHEEMGTFMEHGEKLRKSNHFTNLRRNPPKVAHRHESFCARIRALIKD